MAEEFIAAVYAELHGNRNYQYYGVFSAAAVGRNVTDIHMVLVVEDLLNLYLMGFDGAVSRADLKASAQVVAGYYRANYQTQAVMPDDLRVKSAHYRRLVCIEAAAQLAPAAACQDALEVHLMTGAVALCSVL